MTPFDNMLINPAVRDAAAAFSMLAVVTTLAAVAWLSIRRAAARRPHAVENRAWTYCPRCGWRRPAAARGSSPDAPARPIRDANTEERATASEAVPLPSTLLRRGWTRSAALDREGRIVLPCDPQAVAWSLWGAADAALKPGGKAWREWFRLLTEILDERNGGKTMQHWNREPRRTHSEIVAVAEEIERRMGLGSHPHDRRNHSERTTA